MVHLPGNPMKKHYVLAALAVAVLLVSALQSSAQTNYPTPYAITTIAGSAGYGSVDGTGATARFFGARGMAVDGAGNAFVADSRNCTIRKVTPAGVVTTLAGVAGAQGSVDGAGSGARFYGPTGIAIDGAGNLYVTEFGDHTIRKVTATGTVTTFAGLAGRQGSSDGVGSDARFNLPSGIAVDRLGNLFVLDQTNNVVREVTAAGVVTTLATLSPQIDPQYTEPPIPYGGVGVDVSGNVYVAGANNNTIQKVGTNGEVTVFAGTLGQWGYVDGVGADARFVVPSGVAVDAAGNLYVGDIFNNAIRKVTPAGAVTTLVGGGGQGGTTDGPRNVARFSIIAGLALDPSGALIVSDQNAIRKVTPAGAVTTLAGSNETVGYADGPGNIALFNLPFGIAVDSSTNLFVTDSGNNTIRKITPAGVVSTFAGSPGNSGSADGVGSAARFTSPQGAALDSAGNLYVADAGNYTIRKISPSGVVTTLAGSPGAAGSADGSGSAAQFNSPRGVAVDGAGNVYVTDFVDHTIRKVTPDGLVTTLAGVAGVFGWADGTGDQALFNRPFGIAADSPGNLYVADSGSQVIRKITAAGDVTTLAGQAGVTGTKDGTVADALFWEPIGVAVDRSGNVYVTESLGAKLRKITADGHTSTLAGLTANLGDADGVGSAARFSYPTGVAVDASGTVYIADDGNNLIRSGHEVPPPPGSLARLIITSGPSLGFYNGQFRFMLAGPVGGSVVVESSTDLVNWTPVWTNNAFTDLIFIDPQSSSPGSRFFRAYLP